MKKCKGCGVDLQTDNPKLVGYAKDINQEYCQRCFRLTHYGDTSKLEKENISNSDIVKIYDAYKKDVFVLIIDAFDALNLLNDDLLNYFKDKKLLLVINKIDLLPRNVNDNKLENIFINVISKLANYNIIDCLITYKGDQTFNDLFFETIKDIKTNRFIFAGRVNAGKTTIINKLLNNNDLTVSTYPGTTVNENLVECNGYSFVDTPGLIDEKSFINKLDKKVLKFLIPNKCVKPKVFQFYENQSYLVEGLVRFDVLAKKNSSITFYIKNELDVHRSKLYNSDNYLDKHYREFKLRLLPFDEKTYKNIKNQTFYIKGLGYISIKGYTDVRILINKDIEVYKCEVNI